MSIRFELDTSRGYVHLSCTGACSFDSVLSLIEKGFAAAEEEGLIAVLFDLREVTGTFTTMELFSAGEAIAEAQQRSSLQTFLAVAARASMIDPRRFAETVAINRGGVGKVCADMDEAVLAIEEWINKHEKS